MQYPWQNQITNSHRQHENGTEDGYQLRQPIVVCFAQAASVSDNRQFCILIFGFSLKKHERRGT